MGYPAYDASAYDGAATLKFYNSGQAYFNTGWSNSQIDWLKVEGRFVPTQDRGHQTLLRHGLQIQACVAGHDDPYGRWAESNYTSPLLTGNFSPGSAVFGGVPNGYGRWSNGGTFEFDNQNLVNISYKDEQNLTDPSELEAAKPAFETYHRDFPDAMAYVNQYGSQSSWDTMRNYMEYCKPDLLLFDTYPFTGEVAGGSPTSYYSHLEKFSPDISCF